MKKVFAGCFILLSLSIQAQTVTRKISLTKGQQIEQLSKINTNITQEAMGQAMEIKMESDVTTQVDVKEVSASGFEVSNTLRRVTMTMDMMGQETKFDSDKKEDMEGQVGKAYKGKIGTPTDYTVNSSGIITVVKAKKEEKQEAGGMVEGIVGGVTEEQKAGSSLNALANIPNRSVSVGESWSDTTSEGGSVNTTKYTLREVKGSTALVSVDGVMTISRDMEQQGMAMHLEMKGTTTGEYTFDTNTGIIQSRKAVTKAEGTVDVMGQSIPMSVETTITATVSSK